MLFTSESSETVTVKQISRLPDRCLLVAFRESTAPILWQLGLGSSQNAVIALREDGDAWTIGFTGTGDTFTAVARFDNRDDAEEAFESIQKAFMKGRPLSSYPIWRWAAIVLILFGVIVFAGALLGSARGPRMPLKTAVEQATGQNATAGQPEKGVPVVADDVLKNPESPFGMLAK